MLFLLTLLSFSDASIYAQSDMVGGRTLSESFGIKAQLNGGMSLLRGVVGAEADVLMALAPQLDIGITVRGAFYPWLALTPGVKVRASLLERGNFDLGIDVSAAAIIIENRRGAASPGVTVEPGLLFSYRFHQRTRFYGGFLLLPAVIFDFTLARTTSVILGFNPRLGFVRDLRNRLALFVQADLIPTLDLSTVKSPQVPVFSANASIGMLFGI
jgi:hypothetical protein